MRAKALYEFKFPERVECFSESASGSLDAAELRCTIASVPALMMDPGLRLSASVRRVGIRTLDIEGKKV